MNMSLIKSKLYIVLTDHIGSAESREAIIIKQYGISQQYFCRGRKLRQSIHQ